MNNETDVLSTVISKLRWIIDDFANYNKNNLEDESLSLKVRPDYGYAKFYLDWVEGSYDMSLQALIQFMMYEHRLFKKVLSKETTKEVNRFYKKNPESIYYFENEKEQEIIDNIEWIAVSYVALRLDKYKIAYDKTGFESCGYDEWNNSLSFISDENLYANSILNEYRFSDELEEYLKEHTLTQQEQDSLFEISKESGYFNKIIEILGKSYSSLTDKILRLAIGECKKKSECSILIAKMKKIESSQELIDMALARKEVV